MIENTPMRTPPNQIFVAPIIFHIKLFYTEIYQIGSKLPKRDKLGIHAAVDKICLKVLTLSIKASLEGKIEKQKTTRILRIETEMLKHLVRAEFELGIIKEKQYLLLQEKLQEISKEAVGWERYAHKNPQQREFL